jgi:exopolyphosphatase/guanosine-5'-triphosphate,3'-diphosphate pyrophosphatase
MNTNLVAAIDVGSSAIRMEIAEIGPEGSLRSLESLTRGVSLGKDSFTSGHLSEESIQTACKVLSDFSRVMKTYEVTRYRAVATSAVREASNADLFLDRVFMRSGIDIEIIDGAEQNRLTYLAIHGALSGIVDLQSRNVLVVEVGGGSTDISFIQSGETTYSGTFSLGAVRLRQTMLEVEGDSRQKMKLLDRQIRNEVKTITNSVPLELGAEMVALGGDIRFAARQMNAEAAGVSPTEHWVLDRKDFGRLCTDIAKYDTEELVRRYGVSYSEAETLAPALLAYRSLAERTKAEKIHVLGVSIRAGLLVDMARHESGRGSETFDRQILSSARALARKYHSADNHVEQVRRLALELFDQLKQEHGLGGKARLLLEVAAILHDVGSFISNRAHHKHSQYIIASSDIFGLSRDDVNLVANIARYHRKSPPTRAHLPYISLDRDSRVTVSKLAAILRVADSLEQDEGSKIRSLRLTRDDENERYLLEVEAEGDLSMERLALESKQDMFQEIYGLPVFLRQVERIE